MSSLVIEPPDVQPGHAFERGRFAARLRVQRPHFYKFLLYFANKISDSVVDWSDEGDFVLAEGKLRRLVMCASRLESTRWPILTSSFTGAYTVSTMEKVINLNIFNREVAVTGSAGELAYILERVAKALRSTNSPGIRDADVVRSDARRLGAIDPSVHPLAFMTAEAAADSNRSLLVYGTMLGSSELFLPPTDGGIDGAEADVVGAAISCLTENGFKSAQEMRAFIYKAQAFYEYLQLSQGTDDIAASRATLALVESNPEAALRLHVSSVILRYPKLSDYLSRGGSGDDGTDDVGDRLKKLHSILQSKRLLTVDALPALENAALSTSAANFDSWCAELLSANDDSANSKLGTTSLRALYATTEYKNFASALADPSVSGETIVAVALASRLVVLRQIVTGGLSTQIAKNAASAKPLARLAGSRSAVYRAATELMYESDGIERPIMQVDVPPDFVTLLLVGDLPLNFFAYAEVVRRFAKQEFDLVASAFSLSNETILGSPEYRARVLDLLRIVVGPLFLNFGYDGFGSWHSKLTELARTSDLRPALRRCVVIAAEAGFQDAREAAKHSLDGVLSDAVFRSTFDGPRFAAAVAAFESALEKLKAVAHFFEVSSMDQLAHTPLAAAPIPPTPGLAAWQLSVPSETFPSGPSAAGSFGWSIGRSGASPTSAAASLALGHGPVARPAGAPPAPWPQIPAAQPPPQLTFAPSQSQQQSKKQKRSGDGPSRIGQPTDKPTVPAVPSSQLPMGALFAESYADKDGRQLVRIGTNVYLKAIVDLYTWDGCPLPFVTRGTIGAGQTSNDWFGPARKSLCPCPGKQGHEDYNSSKHAAPKPRFNQLRVDFFGPPTGGFAELPPMPTSGRQGFGRPTRN